MSDAAVDDWFDRRLRWPSECRALRAVLLGQGLGEVFKWRQPCYTVPEGNVCILHDLKAAPGIGFFKGVLLSDPEGLLRVSGENSRSVMVYQADSVAQIEADTPALIALIRQAMENERAGRTVDLPDDDLALPPELQERMAEDDVFRTAWEALTPGRRRGYVVFFKGAKQSATRKGRIDKHADRILAGKGMHDR